MINELPRTRGGAVFLRKSLSNFRSAKRFCGQAFIPATSQRGILPVEQTLD